MLCEGSNKPFLRWVVPSKDGHSISSLQALWHADLGGPPFRRWGPCSWPWDLYDHTNKWCSGTDAMWLLSLEVSNAMYSCPIPVEHTLLKPSHQVARWPSCLWRGPHGRPLAHSLGWVSRWHSTGTLPPIWWAILKGGPAAPSSAETHGQRWNLLWLKRRQHLYLDPCFVEIDSRHNLQD
jgi:hypothetical protein